MELKVKYSFKPKQFPTRLSKLKTPQKLNFSSTEGKRIKIPILHEPNRHLIFNKNDSDHVFPSLHRMRIRKLSSTKNKSHPN